MNRRLLYIAVPAIIVVAVTVMWKTTPTKAQPLIKPNGAVIRPPAPPLPITQVILFNSGVGYYQREGDVQGDTHVQLTFPVGEINDLLKSLVIQDAGGGRVRSISSGQ